VATRRHCLILLKNRSIKFRARQPPASQTQDMTPTGSESLPPRGVFGPTSRQRAIAICRQLTNVGKCNSKAKSGVLVSPQQRSEPRLTMVSEAQLAFLRSIDTPTVCNLIEIVAPERRSAGYTASHLHCPFPDLPPMVGFAKTATIRARDPVSGSGYLQKRLDYLEMRHGASCVTRHHCLPLPLMDIQ
jgi:hypothetical protein